MEIKQLQYFLAIARSGSLASAADVIGIAQPSLSVQLKNLEARLGADLFIRSPRGVTLTDSGAVLVEHAERILEGLDQAKNAVRQASEAAVGQVVFGFPSSVSMVLSVPLAETIRLEQPNIKFRAVDAMSGFIKEWLDEQSIDLAILYETSGLKNAEVTQLLEEDMYFYAPPDLWPLETPPGEPVPLRDLSGLEMVLPSKSHGLRMLIDRSARGAISDLNVVVEMDSLPQIKSFVSRGSAYTILAPAAVSDFESRGELVSARIVDPVISRPVYMVRNPAKPRTRAANEVEKTTRLVVEDLVTRGLWRGNFNKEMDAMAV